MTIRTATAHLVGVSPYSQSGYISTEKLDGEGGDAFEKRTWRDRCHTMPDGRLFIPPMAFKKALDDGASYSPMKIKGRGAATYSKLFRGGVIVSEPLVLPIKKDDVPGEWFFMDSQPSLGKKSPRVHRCYPRVDEWEGDVVFHVLDPTITKDIFEGALVTAGQFIGIGRFRPQNAGYYGRFRVESIKWS